MKIKELEEMLAKDLHIEMDDLAKASIETPSLHAKWMKFATEEGFKLTVLQQRMAKLKKAKWEFYLGRGPGKQYADPKNAKYSNLKLTKTEIPIYIDADDDIQRLALEIEKQSILVDRLSEAVKSIQFRHTNIKNAIEWQKIQNGIMG